MATYTLDQLKKMSSSSQPASAPGGALTLEQLQSQQSGAGKSSGPTGWYGKIADTLGNIGVGLDKGIGQIAVGAGKLIGNATIGGAINDVKDITKIAYPKLSAKIPTGQDVVNKIATAGGVLSPENLKPQGTAQDVGAFIPQAAAFIAPGTDIESATEALTSKVPGALEKYAPQLGQIATKVATKASQLGIKSAVEGLSNYGIALLTTGGDQKQAKGIGEFAAVVPVIGFGLNALRQPVSKLFGKTGETMINSLVKPLLKDLSYGKDPARGILREGITANSIEDLSSKIASKQQEIGHDIGTINELVDGKVTFDANRALSKIDSGITEAAKKNDTTVFNRLNQVKEALTKNLGAVGGQIVAQGEKDLSNISGSEMFNLKKTIGEMTKFTGNPSDDKTVNSVLKNVYGTLKEMYNSGVAKVDKGLGKQIVDLNERYADMTSAKVAVDHRELLDKRANLISLAGHFGLAAGVIAAVATGNWKDAAAGLLSEVASNIAGSTAVKTRVAQFLSGMADADRANLLNQSTTLKRIFGEFGPLGKADKAAPSTDVPGVYKTGERYPQLPAPAPGAPQSGNNVPINLGAQSPSTAAANEQANMVRGPGVQ